MTYRRRLTESDKQRPTLATRPALGSQRTLLGRAASLRCRRAAGFRKVVRDSIGTAKV